MLLSDNTPSAASTLFTSTLVKAIATNAAVSNATSLSTTEAGAENGECKLLGPFALFVQGALGILALGSLVFKRWRERPQRPVKIWAFDASKQVVGSGLLHLANLFMAMLSSGELTPTPKAGDYQANPCSFYLLNLAIDVSSTSSFLQGCHADTFADYDRYRHSHMPSPGHHTFVPLHLFR